MLNHAAQCSTDFSQQLNTHQTLGKGKIPVTVLFMLVLLVVS